MLKISREKVAEALGISVEGLKELLKRQKGLLIKRGELSAQNILDSYAFLPEIQKREEREKNTKLAKTIKNIKIAKHAEEIIDLYMGGFGAIRIEKHLFLNHKIKIGRSTIERFIKDSNLQRGGKNGKS